MQEYFARLMDYDRHVNLRLTEVMIGAGEPEKAVGLMAHLLAAQQVWLNRCKQLPAYGGALWPDWKAGTFKSMIEENHRNWKTFLATLEPADFLKQIHYVNLRGETCNDVLNDVLAHLVNHGTHHRAQIGQELKLAGVEKLPVTDYIFYVRSL
jgi:uncharacterized damage-inducible protein DinB